MTVKARISGVEAEGGGTYTAYVTLEAGRSERVLRLCRLARRPASARVREQGEFIIIELVDEKGEGFASCPIHRSHIEGECLDCPTLLLPRGEIADKNPGAKSKASGP